MKKQLLAIISHAHKSFFVVGLLFISIGSKAQQQPQNASFEEWEMVGFENQFPEPVNWSSLKTSDPENLGNVAPEVLFKSTDAHTGSFSIHMINKSVFGIVANGLITNGRVLASFTPGEGNTYTDPEDSQWNTPFSSRPDSVVGYYKYISVDNDAPLFTVILHFGIPGSIPQPDTLNWVGKARANLANVSVSEWTRFSIPFNYYLGINPEFILFNITSGNGLDAVAGSEAWFDDIELIYNVDGIDEHLAENLLNAYGYENTIVADLTRFGMGSRFELGIYDLTGKLIKKQTLESGSKYEINDFQPGLYICSFQNSDGLVITKKVVVP